MVNAGGSGTAGIDGSGYVTSHTFTHTSSITVADYDACMDCHSRGNTPSGAVRAAPIVTPVRLIRRFSVMK